MANPEHLKILEQGVEVWNLWRVEHRTEVIDLSGAVLRNARLHHDDLSQAYFRLLCAELSDAYEKSSLAKIIAHLRSANLDEPNLSEANLIHAWPSIAKLSYAWLADADLFGAYLSGADLSQTDLSQADLRGAHLSGANLWGANLSRSNLFGANLIGAELTETDLSIARIGATTFANVDLSEVTGLDSVFHTGPSTVGIDTLYKSGGQIPDKFLRDAGVPEEIIDLARSIRAGPAIQWHSCFISYSTKDDDFARRLHARMREANMRVWFAPEDMQGGKKLHEQIYEAIQLNDRLLLVLSEHSIQSEWVLTEIRKARATELKEKRRKLFPIRLADIATLRDWTCFDADTGKDLAVELREYFIPDFSNWKDHDAFEAAFARLQKDLQAEDQRRTP